MKWTLRSMTEQDPAVSRCPPLFPAPGPLPDFPKAGPTAVANPVLSLSGYRLRPCRNADLAFLRRLFRHGRDAELAGTGWPEDFKRAFCLQQFDAQHTDYLRRFPQADFLLILDRRAPVGRLTIDRSGPDIHLVDIGLLPSCRGRGLGTAVLLALQDLAEQRGAGVVLNVGVNNPRAAALYRRMGFQPQDSGPTHQKLRWMPPSS
jgi:ribosomal protein S18 acetylase RimI-like enzyme